MDGTIPPSDSISEDCHLIVPFDGLPQLVPYRDGSGPEVLCSRGPPRRAGPSCLTCDSPHSWREYTRRGLQKEKIRKIKLNIPGTFYGHGVLLFKYLTVFSSLYLRSTNTQFLSFGATKTLLEINNRETVERVHSQRNGFLQPRWCLNNRPTGQSPPPSPALHMSCGGRRRVQGNEGTRGPEDQRTRGQEEKRTSGREDKGMRG